MIEDSKGLSRSSTTKKEGQCNDQKKKNKQWHYTENETANNMNPT
jgi:hypothetical protein